MSQNLGQNFFTLGNVCLRPDAIRRAESILGDTQARRKGGVALREVVLRAEVQLAESREALVLAREGELDAVARLNNVMGRNASLPLEVIDLESQPPLPGALTELLEQAAAQRPEVGLARQAVAAAQGLQLREGASAHIGQAVMTLIDSGRWLVVANFRENARSRLRQDQPARVAFGGMPGRIFDAPVVSVGWGVSQRQGVPSGQLPDVKLPTSWVPPAQRFQVRLTLDDPRSVPLRVGMTGSAAVYTEPEGVLNDVTRFWHQVISWLYHL